MSSHHTHNELTHLSLEILKRIPNKRKVTAAQIHEQLSHSGINRSLRTIQRHLDMLSHDFTIEKDESSKPFGYRALTTHSSLSLSKLSPQESVLLSLAHQYLANLLPPSILKTLDGFFEEAQYQLYPDEHNKKEREWLKKVIIVDEGLPLLAPGIDQEVFEKISEALFHDKLLNIDYYNSNQIQRRAQVMPLGLAQQGKRLYLVCRFDGYQNERNIAIHRVTKAIVSSFSFKRPPEFKLSQYDADGRFGFSNDKKCQINFCIDKQAGFHLKETPLDTNQILTECEDHYHIAATLPDSLWLDRWLKGFGDDVWNIKKTNCEE